MRPKSALRNKAEWLATSDAWAEERGMQQAIEALGKELSRRIGEKSQKTINRLVGLGDHAAVRAIAHAIPDSIMKFYALQASHDAMNNAQERDSRKAAAGRKP